MPEKALMIKHARRAFFFIPLFFLLITQLSQAETLIHHDLKVVLSPGSHLIQVVDRLSLSPSFQADQQGKFYFSLNESLFPIALTPGVMIERELALDDKTPKISGMTDLGIQPEANTVPLTHYSMTLPIGLREVVIRYEGLINNPLVLKDNALPTVEADTSGMISEEGIFLSEPSAWYPDFNQQLISFNLDITLPQDWNAVSQGKRTQHFVQGDTQHIRWESPEPQEHIFLVGGKWTEYKRKTGRVLILALLKTPDSELAKRYLKAAEQYLTMYQELLGPYPYAKFALVENFWEAQYGLPSFTLMGPKALRSPATIHAIFPYELLRNWWGNGVYVNQNQGNWSEGLIAYLSDYLKREQNDTAQALRLTLLQQYAHTVTRQNEVPLSLFQGWSDPASQAIGYGKGLFLFHMFRQSLGDKPFINALRTFFHENRFKHTSFETLAQAFGRSTQQDLSEEFMQWVRRKGAPVLRAKHVLSEKTDTGYRFSALIEQQQPGPAYPLNIPIVITLQGEKAPFQTTVDMKNKTLEIAIDLPTRPVRFQIDPEYNLFRALHPAEMPPSIEEALNAESTLILLPSTASIPLRSAYQKLARSMKQERPDHVSIGWDNEYTRLPDDQSVWLLGWENRFQRTILKELTTYDVSMNSAMTRIGDIQIPRRNHSIVLSTRHPKSTKYALSWFATDHAAAIPVFGKKLSQYGPYGYLAFKGNALKDVEKGRWPPVGSPMSIRIKQDDGRWIKEVPTTLAKRDALTSISPLFSEEQMWGDITFLSSDQLKGRGFGTPELDRTAEYIAAAFRQAGLSPADDAGRSFLQQWTGEHEGIGSGVALKNVVAMLPGTASGLKHEYIVIGAHYDHLGFGWPRVHEGEHSTIHPGANANASGVALMLELARVLKKDKPLQRSILFAAFTANEVGLRGSQHLVSSQAALPAGLITSMINLDTVGRLQENRLFVLGTESSREWPPILRRIGFETGIEIASFPETLASSDHISFIQEGIPAIRFFTGITPETDRPTDTIEKIDLPGMVAIGRVVKEVIEDLANRPLPLTGRPDQKMAPSLIWERRAFLTD